MTKDRKKDIGSGRLVPEKRDKGRGGGYDKATNREEHKKPVSISDTAPPPRRPKPGGSNDEG